MPKIGMLTPSSNTVLEPVTYKILADMPGVSAHFSRFTVREITLTEKSDSQFQDESMLNAASLLADAGVDLIVWNGTSASWLGLEKDRKLCESIEEALGIPATTSVFAITEAFQALGVSSIGLVTPYTQDVNAKIRQNYLAMGYKCPVDHGCGISVNKDFADVPAQAIAEMLEMTASETAVEVVTVVCTNFNAASFVKDIEFKYNIPVIDSVSATLWHSLHKLGINPGPLAEKWGRLFLC
ncbi:aspartate/glutamate racemase family protein [Paenibacillus radicis (ex Xue et al. 2023)]|uniref:Aspartate/glutamate racemase family protein n=1 Tax=Paenibacillus radicis (ex Xue et al. 2023) TaxID=2972489 RepID=A0ABT1YDT8_9BACL|nr:aspartate/glutamate racemase family protein [Paenibacillus radicis (ex Xue et al. 2023)]MCR8630388.1 aspartate/glutamate racemase family protein [Paenibacillus radicis (ex Xue et al. 2023)]